MTWAGPRALAAAYRAGTGRPAPTASSARYSVLAKVAWALAVAGLVALAESLLVKELQELGTAHASPEVAASMAGLEQ